jgi:AbrB family looped-hinge helix DNA binding protein
LPKIYDILLPVEVRIREAAMRITSKGQVTIPQDIREQLGLLPHTEVEFRIAGGKAYIAKTKEQKGRGKALIARMKGRATVRMSTDEIMALTRG